MNYLDTIKRWEAEGEATRPAYRKSLIDEKNEINEIIPPPSEAFPQPNAGEVEGEEPQPADKKSTSYEFNELSPFQPNPVTDNLLSRLRAGTVWLTDAHQAWLAGSPGAADDERFSVALAAWTEMERVLRVVFNFEGCIHGSGSRCSANSPISCDFCVRGNEK
jgi:hypothetical protein